MTSFNDKLLMRKYESNIVIKIDNVYYSQKQPDSGLKIDENKIGIVLDVSVSPVKYDILNSNTPITTISFGLLDKNEAVSADILTLEIGSTSNVAYQDAWIGRETVVYAGFINCSQSFSQYKIVAKGTIRAITKQPNRYNITCYDELTTLAGGFDTYTYLTADITDSDIIIPVSSVTLFMGGGIVKIGDEFIPYTGTSGNTLTGATRGGLGSTAEAHETSDKVYNVIEYEDHPINIIRDILLTNFMPNYNDATFTAIRDGALLLDGDFLLYIYDESDIIKYIEKELLQATNTRFVNQNGNISLVILDQANVPSGVIDESSIRSISEYKIDGNKVINKVVIRYDFNYATGKFEAEESFQEDESILHFGTREKIFEFKGMRTTHSGAAMAANRAQRILNRFAFPKPEITIKTHFDQANILPSDLIQLSYKHLPTLRGTGLGLNDILEVVGMSYLGLGNDPHINFDLQYTSFGNNRFGAISPSPAPINITDQSVFEVPDGSLYAVGYALRLWDTVAEAYCADAVNTIASINGNEITMTNAWTTVLSSDLRLFFAEYDDCTDAQRESFAFISPDANIFSDNIAPYMITL